MSWVILGAGRSGFGAKKLLDTMGENSVLFDDNAALFADNPSVITTQDHPVFEEKGLQIVVSPGFPPNHGLLLKAKDRGQYITTEIDLALDNFQGSLIAVTGTNGKSTTVMMISHLLNSLAIKHSVGGNIGIAASSVVIEKQKLLVLELSSYQLEESKNVAPHIAVFTGISPDHQSRHGSMKQYLACKWRIFENQTPSDFAIIENKAYDFALKMGLPQPKSNLTLVDENTFADTQVRQFNWKHDRVNGILAATAVSKTSSLDVKHLLLHLANFTGLPYRCQIIGKLHGHRIINDSKSTTIDSTLHALSDAQGKATLFLGGLSKGEKFHQIAEYKHKIAKIIAFGQTGQQIVDELEDILPVSYFSKLRLADHSFRKILNTLQGDLLFSPACPSQDEFRDFEERGSFFNELCRAYLSKEDTHESNSVDST